MDETLKTFLASIEEQSWREIDSLASEVAPEHVERTEQVRAQAMRQVESYKQKELSAIAQKQRLDADTCREESRKKLLAVRAACSDEAEAALYERLRAYTASAEYPGRLAALLRRGLEALGADEAVVFLREEDMRLADGLRSGEKDVRLSFREGTFALGGLVVEAPRLGRRADLSFDAALNDARAQFGEIFGLELE